MDHETVRLRLRSAGVPVARTEIAPSFEAVAGAFERLADGPVVLKAGGLLHKSDAGGVVLDLVDADTAAAAADRILQRHGERALPFVLQRQARGMEILVGARRDPQLGPALVVGLGGVATEVHQDVVTSIVPVTEAQALSLLQQLRIWPLLRGYRGEPGRDVDALVEILVAVSALVQDDPGIVELDLNPVMVGPVGAGAVCVDARIIRGEHRAATPRPRPDLDRMLRPEHVAVVGVSDDEHKVGSRLFRYLDTHGYPGRLDPVHPSGGSVRGYQRVASLSEVEGSPDLVCVAVPSRFVLDVAREAVEKKVGGVIVHSSDFAEVGSEGRRVQNELVSVLSAANIPLAGPNNMGVVAPHRNLTASISGGLECDLVSGGVALLTSSGALGSCLATRLMDAGVGLSYWIHAGNEADLVIADYLEWLADDDATTSVALLLEDIKDGPRFVDAGRRMARAGKPMFAYNMVRSDKAREAALSHTGAMVGSFPIREAAVRAAGMVSVESLRVLEDALALSATTRPPAGPRLAAVTFSGGACSIIADEADRLGVELPALSDLTSEAVRPHVPSFAAVRNPLDCSYQMLNRPDDFERVVRSLAARDEFDAILLQFTTNADPYATAIADKVIALREQLPIPLYASRYGGERLAPQALAVYREAGVPLLDAPDRATRAVAALVASQRAVRTVQAGPQ